MNIVRHCQFDKNLKKLLKRFKSLEDDLELFEKVVTSFPTGNGSKHWNCITKNNKQEIFKTRIACRSYSGGDDFRLIYCYFKNENKIEFIELFFKGDKENHDMDLLNSYLIDIEK